MSSPPQLGDFSRRRPGPPPCVSPGVCPFSFCSASSAPRSPSLAGGLLRRDQAGEESERTPLNLKPRLAGVGVPQGSPSRCTPRASARAHSGARRGLVPLLCHCACAAGPSRPRSALPGRPTCVAQPISLRVRTPCLAGAGPPLFASLRLRGCFAGGRGRRRLWSWLGVLPPLRRASCGMFAPPLAGAHNPGSSAVA